MGFDQGEIIVDSPTGAYFAGQYVDGRLVFELQEVKKFKGIYLNVKGFCKVHWTTHRTRRVKKRTRHYTLNHDSYEEYITLNMYLVGSENAEHTLNPGKHEYPFRFQLPPTCPSSFEGSAGHVRYELRAVMDIPYAVNEEVFRDIQVVAPPLDLNAIDCKDPASFEFEQTFCCWCCTSGVTETVVKIPVRGYCPGQVIPVEVSCKNRSNVEINYISCSIKKKVSYRAQSSHNNEENVLVEAKKGLLPPHTDHLWQLDLAVPEMDFHNLDTCSFIDIIYSFNVTVSPSGCHEDEDDSCQLFFGTVPLLGYSNLTQQTNMNPPAYTPFPQPAINQPVPVNPSYQPNSPFPPNPYPSNSPYPSPDPQQKSAPYPMEDKPSLGMPGQESSPSVPLLPPGSVPYPIGLSTGRSSPFAGASAPNLATPTPDNEKKIPLEDDQSNSPFNPAFMEGKKETPEDK